MGIIVGNPNSDTKPWMATVGCRDWIETEWPPSFKDVPFAVHTDAKSGGRRIHIHEYPEREWWDNEDMGRLRQQMDVSAYVFGDSADDWAEQLFAVCVDARIGTLYLPQRPPVQARCMTVESLCDEDKGIINFTIRFVLETGEAMGLVPSKFKSPIHGKSQVSSTARNVADASRSSFEEGFTGNQNQMARTQAAATMRQVVQSVRRTLAQSRVEAVESTQINLDLQRISAMADEITDLHKSVPNVLTPKSYTKTQQAPGINILPAEGFGYLLTEIMNLLVTGTTSPADLRQALIPLTQLTVKAVFIRTQATRDYSTDEELHLASEIAALARRLALALTCSSVIRSSSNFMRDLVNMRDSLLLKLDNEAFLASSDDPTYVALRTLRSAISDFIANHASGGSTTKKYEFQALMPVAVYAANIYPSEPGTNGRDVEIVELNSIDHPMFPQKLTVSAYKAPSNHGV